MGMWKARFEVIKSILRPLWVRILLPFATLYGIYDSTAHQLLPPGVGEKFPTIYGIVLMTSGLIPLWGWSLIVAAIFAFATIEYLARSQHNASQTRTRAPERDTSLLDAVRYVAFGRWGADPESYSAEGAGYIMSEQLRAAHEIRQAARDGSLKIWGLDWPNSGVFNPIDADYWAAYAFDEEDVLRGEPGELSSKAEAGGGFVPPGVKHALQTSRAQIEKLWAPSPLEIFFDPSNPGRKFWSLEPMRDANGKQVPGSFWQYRAAIKNLSTKTIGNVRVSVEATGPMPTRPEHSIFDINKKPLIDLAPGQEALAVIRSWWNPTMVAGVVVGTDMYGPIKMIAYGDDVRPAMKVFHFDPEKVPMIWE